MLRSEEGFFDTTSAKNAIARLSRSDSLTIFVGAGGSADQGVPVWRKLVEILLADRLSKQDSRVFAGTNPAAQELAESIVKIYGELSAASIVDELYFEEQIQRGFVGEDARNRATRQRNNAIRRELYPKGVRPNNRLSLAQYVIRLAVFAKATGADVEILTTNYDHTVELVAANDVPTTNLLSDRGYEVRPSVSKPLHSTNSEIPVVHVHGSIPPTGVIRHDAIVFSEDSYVRWLEESGSLRTYMFERFRHTDTLFVGTSLRDYNIADVITRSSRSGSATRIALLPTQDDIDAAHERQLDITNGFENFARLRGEHIGVEVLRPDFRGQVCQFLNEAAAARTRVNRPKPYSGRLNEWRASWMRSIGHPNDAKVMKWRIDETRRMQRTLLDIRKVLGTDVTIGKIELWVRSKSNERLLELWLSTQSAWLPHQDHFPHAARIEHGSEYAAVVAFRQRGTSYGKVTYRSDDRWTHYVAVPIVLPDPPVYEVPVGVVTMLVRSLEHRDHEAPPSLQLHLELIIDKMVDDGLRSLSPSRAKQ